MGSVYGDQTKALQILVFDELWFQNPIKMLSSLKLKKIINFFSNLALSRNGLNIRNGLHEMD